MSRNKREGKYLGRLHGMNIRDKYKVTMPRYKNILGWEYLRVISHEEWQRYCINNPL